MNIFDEIYNIHTRLGEIGLYPYRNHFAIFKIVLISNLDPLNLWFMMTRY